MNKVKLLCGLMLGMAAAGVAQADNGFYVGANLGQAAYQEGCDGAGALGFTSCDDTDTGWKLLGGYDLNENFAIEAAWVDLGELSVSGGPGQGGLEADGIVVDVKATLPLNDRFGVFAKLGFINWDQEGTGVLSGFDDSGTDAAFGAGAVYMLNQQVGIVGEWERFDYDGDDADLLSVGAFVRF